MTVDGGIYVYAIVPAGQELPADTTGVGSPSAPVRSIRQGRLAAIVSEAPPDLRARRRDLLAHQDLLLRLSERGPVLPMRFGTVATDEATLRDQLTARESDHMTVLEHVFDGVEYNLKALQAQDALANVVAEDEGVRRLRDAMRRQPGYEASLRLGEAVAAALQRRAVEAGRRIVHELTPRARAVAAGPEVQGCVLNTSFLVGRGDSEVFRSAAEDLAAANRDRVELRIAGPLPCYSFVAAGQAPARTAGT